jgi:hypothetical protein
VRTVRKGTTSISYQDKECLQTRVDKEGMHVGDAVASYLGVTHSVVLATLQISQLGLHD